ncbi:helix-turn-helix domain-containing protein [Undibacterium sp. Ren11W]|uniref:helix-turn-helix domain-containing protein n=1 Tax=Undibacterium sp. Ren11W TaxID=3413045 RepID=UPI003BF40995
MNALNGVKKTAQGDWHRAQVIAELHMAGWSMRKLSMQSGYKAQTLGTALDKPYLRAEKIIAAAIGIAPEVIWPERYAKRNFTPVLPLSLRNTQNTSRNVIPVSEPLNAVAA